MQNYYPHASFCLRVKLVLYSPSCSLGMGKLHFLKQSYGANFLCALVVLILKDNFIFLGFSLGKIDTLFKM